MANYLYNGVKLPELPTWDRTKYPYAIIGPYDSTYILCALNKKPQYGTFVIEEGENAGSYTDVYVTYLYGEDYSYVMSISYRGGKWTEPTVVDNSDSVASNVRMYFRIDYDELWTNTDIPNLDAGGIYLAASDPILVPDPEHPPIEYKLPWRTSESYLMWDNGYSNRHMYLKKKNSLERYVGVHKVADEPLNCLVYSSETEFTIGTEGGNKVWDGSMYYSTDGENWNEWDGSFVLTSSIFEGRQTILLRGLENTFVNNKSTSASSTWKLTGENISCSGNIENLLDYKVVMEGEHPVMSNYCYAGLFRNNANLISAPELPATELTEYCYAYTFGQCSALTRPPILPAMKLAARCYYYMFSNCTGLLECPNLPAKQLADYCYYNMFYNCSSITTPPVLHSKNIAQYCYAYMFQNCKSLTAAPALPALELQYSCYYYMFSGCSKLRYAPKLPATKLAGWCYADMFQNCTSLLAAPALPATKLETYCYYYMFSGCTSLKTLPLLPAKTLASSCYYYMFNGCKSIKLSLVQNSEYTNEFRVPSTGSGVTATSALSSMFSSTGGTFSGTPDINTTYYTSNDVDVSFVELPDTYVTFKDSTQFTLQTKNNLKNWDGSIEYSTDAINWTVWDGTSALISEPQDRVFHLYMRGLANTQISTSSDTGFVFTNATATKASGNIECLLDYDLVQQCEHPTMSERCFSHLFANTKLSSAPELFATKLSDYCYEGMFENCSLLEHAPALFATTLAVGCYSSMFKGCINLIQAPSLTVTALTDYCYNEMFSGCSSLRSCPDLPSTSLKEGCYKGMFSNCSSLQILPKLNASSLVVSCYEEMFANTGIVPVDTKVSGTNYIAYRIPTSATANPVEGALTNMFGSALTPQINTYYFIPIESAPIDSQQYYISFYSKNSFVFKFNSNLKTWDGVLEYSYDTISWSEWVPGSQVIVPKQESGYFMYLRGRNNSLITNSNNKIVLVTKEIVHCCGNLENLLDYQKVQLGQHPRMSAHCFRNLLSDCSTLVPKVTLPATVLSDYCYYGLFSNCSLLQSIVELPASTMTPYCYAYMFRGCTSLESAPALSSTNLAAYCYQSMFNGCSMLKSAPLLPATTMQDYCYSGMFQSCSSLTATPVLNSTSLAEYCYQNMFNGCSSITKTPTLPATVMKKGCYYQMFQSCSNLVTCCALPSKQLAEYCYYSMYYSCPKLTTLNKLPALNLQTYCYAYMYAFCTGIKFSNSYTSSEYNKSYRIPTSGTGVDASSSMYRMFYYTGGAAHGTPYINITYYTSNTLV